MDLDLRTALKAVPCIGAGEAKRPRCKWALAVSGTFLEQTDIFAVFKGQEGLAVIPTDTPLEYTMASTFKSAQATDAAAAKTNLVYFNVKDAAALESAPGKTVAPKKNYVEIKNYIFTFAYVVISLIQAREAPCSAAYAATHIRSISIFFSDPLSTF